MTTYTQILYQIVFGTYRRKPVMTKPNRDELYKYIWGTLEGKKCFPYIINGVGDHLHIVTDVHPSVAVSSLIKDVKLSSSNYIKQQRLFPGFTRWQQGYGAFTYSHEAKKNLIAYVENQEIHHRKIDYRYELKSILSKEGVEYDTRYLP
jgi:REP element-mobilizing transposase RayT